MSIKYYSIMRWTFTELVKYIEPSRTAISSFFVLLFILVPVIYLYFLIIATK